jgi:recombination endonuclease VII
MSSIKRKYLQEYYKKHRTQIKRRSRTWHRAHPEQVSVRHAMDYKANTQKYKDRAKQFAKRHPNKRKKIARKSHLKITFKMSLEDFAKRVKKQKGHCAGCGARLHKGNCNVDHNHTCCPGKKSCGKCIRGILCSPCNQALGLLKDSVKTLLRLVRYLS